MIRASPACYLLAFLVASLKLIFMNAKAILKKCQLLKAGQVVEIDGNFFRAIHLGEIEASSPCYVCTLDSICTGNITDVCANLETFPDDRWILKLASDV